MNIESEIERLKINQSIDSALLFSLFEAHPNQTGVLKSLRFYAEKLEDLSMAHTFSDASISVQRNLFQELLKALEKLSHKPAQK